jgi:hypothetical protein
VELCQRLVAGQVNLGLWCVSCLQGPAPVQSHSSLQQSDRAGSTQQVQVLDPSTHVSPTGTQHLPQV